MLRSEAVARIQRGMGFRSDRATEIASCIQEAQRELEKGKTLPKFLLREDQSLSLVAATNAVTLPTDFLLRSATLIHYTPLYTTRTRDIPWRDYNAARNVYAAYNPGGPAVVSLRATTLWFEPLADRAYTLTWDYYKKADVLDSDSDTNEWLDDDNVPEYLIGEAGLRFAIDARNSEAIELFTRMIAKARASVFSDTVRNEADEVVAMGGDN